MKVDCTHSVVCEFADQSGQCPCDHQSRLSSVQSTALLGEITRLLDRILRNDSDLTEDAARGLSLKWIARAAAKLKHRLETPNDSSATSRETKGTE